MCIVNGVLIRWKEKKRKEKIFKYKKLKKKIKKIWKIKNKKHKG